MAIWDELKPFFEDLKEYNELKAKERLEFIAKLRNTLIAPRTEPESNDATIVSRGRLLNLHLRDKDKSGHYQWALEHPVLNAWGTALNAVPFIVASAPLISVAGNAAAATTAGLAITSGLNFVKNAATASKWLPWLDAGATSLFGAPGVIDMTKGNFTPTTAIEVAPLVRPVKLAVKLGHNIMLPVSRMAMSDNPYKTTEGSDIFKAYFAKLKINGKRFTVDGGLVDGPEVRVGLPQEVQDYLNKHTVARNIREFRKAGYSESEILNYQDKVNREMLQVRRGEYSSEDYKAANGEDMGGFYDSNANFISINTDAKRFSKNFVYKHEGRHLIDHKTSLLDSLLETLSKAYDNDFLNIPNTKYAGTLKGYKNMNRESFTTNRDSRDVLLHSLLGDAADNISLDRADSFIRKSSDEAIFNAVALANGYGRRYIQFLRDNNKLTPEKAQLFREAMIHVGGYAIPLTFGAYTMFKE